MAKQKSAQAKMSLKNSVKTKLIAITLAVAIVP